MYITLYNYVQRCTYTTTCVPYNFRYIDVYVYINGALRLRDRHELLVHPLPDAAWSLDVAGTVSLQRMSVDSCAAPPNPTP